MYSFSCYLFIFISNFIPPGYTNPNGSPNSACATMTPGHDVGSQSCSSKYVIQSDKLEYYKNDTVRITVSGSSSSDTFRGILLIAKTKTTNQIIGTWSSSNANIKSLSCGGISNTAITHSRNNDKNSINALWSPPSSMSDPTTVIKATIVQTYSTIYVNCFSISLTAKDSNVGTTTSTATAVSSITGVTSNTGTAVTPGVATTTTVTTTTTTTTTTQSNNVAVNITWAYANGNTNVKMKINDLKASEWFALGLSLDDKMGEDHVFVCKRLADDTISADRLINPNGRDYPVSTSSIGNPGGQFSVTLLKLENGAVNCEFMLSNFTSSKRRRRRAISALSQSTTYRPLVAMGSLDSSNGLNQHTVRAALSDSVQLIIPGTITFGIDSLGSKNAGLMKAHGIIMIFTWILFVSTAIILALFFKKSWPNQKILGKPIWFSVHRALMMTASVLTILAFILILVYSNGKWIPQYKGRSFAHSIVGIITISFAAIQPIIAFFRCKPDDEYRFIFNYVHGIVGFTSFLLSIVAIFIAMFLDSFNVESNKKWGVVVTWICWVFIIFVIFCFIEYRFETYLPPNDNSYTFNTQNGNMDLKIEPTSMKHNTRKDLIKGIFLFIHIIIALALSLVLAIFVGKS
ncbi:unnamed protein product [Rotaria magnacalcarata]|uniref:Ferric-chelate reductase 1 n=1 Tax=Rotaria magnacalcarata TaxID=392030 RepID=A0A819RGP0_9BILA|nr:unnamed protein product [Rotaria magnacalcarata]CAF4038602.1 unnamed protein product [Rotaria magnacalcarata]